MKRKPARRDGGFTLVELLVVIAIITVLMAIALPVYSRAREKARQTACMANLHHLAMAVRMYRMDMGAYPGPYDPVTGQGGVNALYPAYLESRRALICPNDPIESGQQYVDQRVSIYESAANDPKAVTYRKLLEAASSLYVDRDPSGNYFVTLWLGRQPDDIESAVDPSFFLERYSSYNALYNWVGYAGASREYSLCDLYTQYLHKGDNLGFWYSWYQWDPENDTGIWGSSNAMHLVESYLHYHLAQQTYWSGYDPWNVETGERLYDSLQRPLWDPGNPDRGSYDYMPYGMPSPVFPGLINRNAPDNTVVTRCPNHRQATRRYAGQDEYGNDTYWESDIALRLDGSAVMVVGLTYDWAKQPRQTQ